MAKVEMEGETGGIGVKVNAGSGGFADKRVDVRQLATELFISQMGATVRTLAEFGIPPSVILDSIMSATANHFAIGTLELVFGQKLVPEAQANSVIDGLGPAIVEATHEAYTLLKDDYLEELENDRADEG